MAFSSSLHSSPSEAEEGGEEAERRARGCRLQYQRAGVRFLAHFVAHPLDGGRHLTYMPSSDWLLDVSHLVQEHARIQDPRVAVLEGGSVVIGREPGMTSVEVRCCSYVLSSGFRLIMALIGFQPL